MSAHLVIQLDERQDDGKRVSYNVTYVPVSRGVISGPPVQIWQREEWGGDVPPTVPFSAELVFDVRQYRNKEGAVLTQPYIREFVNAKVVELVL